MSATKLDLGTPLFDALVRDLGDPFDLSDEIAAETFVYAPEATTPEVSPTQEVPAHRPTDTQLIPVITPELLAEYDRGKIPAEEPPTNPGVGERTDTGALPVITAEMIAEDMETMQAEHAVLNWSEGLVVAENTVTTAFEIVQADPPVSPVGFAAHADASRMTQVNLNRGKKRKR